MYPLSDMFPYAIDVPADKVVDIAKALLLTAGNAPNGSSFAVTSGELSGKRRVWLSEVSYNRIQGRLEELSAKPTIPEVPDPDTEAEARRQFAIQVETLRPRFRP